MVIGIWNATLSSLSRFDPMAIGYVSTLSKLSLHNKVISLS